MELEHLATLLAVGAFLGGIGRQVTLLVFPNGTKGVHTGWRSFWHSTLWLHPILVGMLIGLTGWLPSPAFFDIEGKDFTLGGVIWYGLAGMFSSTAFYRLDKTIKGEEARLNAKEGTVPDDGEE